MGQRRFTIPVGAALSVSMSGCSVGIDGDWDGVVFSGTVVPLESSYVYDGYSYAFRAETWMTVDSDGSVELGVDVAHTYGSDHYTYAYSYEGDAERTALREHTIVVEDDAHHELELDCTLRTRSVFDCLDHDDEAYTWERR